jgi:hypothetical protein
LGAEELRSEIQALRAAGKKVIFLMENGGDLEYYVAASADRVYAAPQALLDNNGFSATVLFAAAGLDKLGVKAELFRLGAHRNAPNLFTRGDMSPEQREAETSMLGDMASRYSAAVVESSTPIHLCCAKRAGEIGRSQGHEASPSGFARPRTTLMFRRSPFGSTRQVVTETRPTLRAGHPLKLATSSTQLKE